MASRSDWSSIEVVSFNDAIEPFLDLHSDVGRRLLSQVKNLKRKTDLLTEDELAAIYLYEKSRYIGDAEFHSKLNRILCDKNNLGIDAWQPYLKLLCTAISKLPVISCIAWYAAHSYLMHNWTHHKEITWQTFRSYAKTLGAWQQNQDFDSRGDYTLFAIHSVTARNVSDCFYDGSEQELLLLPDTRFKIVNRLTFTGKLHIIQLDEVESSNLLLKITNNTSEELPNSVDEEQNDKRLTSESKQLSSEVARLQNQCKEQETTIKRLRDKIQKLKADNTSYLEQLDNYERENQSLKEARDANDREIRLLKRKIDDLGKAEATSNAATKRLLDQGRTGDESRFASSTTHVMVRQSEGIQNSLTNKVYKRKQAMHHPKNTNADILMKNCLERELSSCKNNCVLITTGSFNPIHQSHLKILSRVKDYLENEQQQWNVLAGYISPTHDEYVYGKLGAEAWISAEDRCQLCEDAIEYERLSSWIAVSRGESEWPGGFVDFGPVTINLSEFLNEFLVQQEQLLKYPLTVVYVCGLDHFNKCSYIKDMARKKCMAVAVVYRNGNDERQVKNSTSQGVIYIPTSVENEIADISSTLIRQYYQNPTSKNRKIKDFICPSVDEYMRKKYKTRVD